MATPTPSADLTAVNLISYGNSQRIYSYKSNDTALQVETAGYFNEVNPKLDVGDIIIGATDLDGTPTLRHYLVSANSGDITIVRSGATAVT